MKKQTLNLQFVQHIYFSMGKNEGEGSPCDIVGIVRRVFANGPGVLC